MLFMNVTLVYQLFENCLKSQDYKRNLIMECAILPLLNVNVIEEPLANNQGRRYPLRERSPPPELFE